MTMVVAENEVAKTKKKSLLEFAEEEGYLDEEKDGKKKQTTFELGKNNMEISSSSSFSFDQVVIKKETPEYLEFKKQNPGAVFYANPNNGKVRALNEQQLKIAQLYNLGKFSRTSQGEDSTEDPKAAIITASKEEGLQNFFPVTGQILEQNFKSPTSSMS